MRFARSLIATCGFAGAGLGYRAARQLPEHSCPFMKAGAVTSEQVFSCPPAQANHQFGLALVGLFAGLIVSWLCVMLVKELRGLR